MEVIILAFAAYGVGCALGRVYLYIDGKNKSSKQLEDANNALKKYRMKRVEQGTEHWCDKMPDYVRYIKTFDGTWHNISGCFFEAKAGKCLFCGKELA